jgi:hypothetical protein
MLIADGYYPGERVVIAYLYVLLTFEISLC